MQKTDKMIKLLVALCLVLPLVAVSVFAQENFNNYLDVETPNFFQYNSPLRQPDSLRNRPYFDFLSTLYRRDATKSDLFRPYQRTRRDVAPAESQAAKPSSEDSPQEFTLDVTPDPLAAAVAEPEPRPKRAIVFRPLFVYKQQMVRREELRKKRRKRV